MIQALYDMRFAFDSDNPFENDSTKTSLNKLKKYLSEHADDFTEIDYLDTSKYIMVCPNLESIYGEKVDRNNCKSEILNAEIKKFIKDNIPKLPQDLQKWVNETPKIIPTAAAAITGAAVATTDTVKSSVDTVSNDIDNALAEVGSAFAIPPMDSKFSQSLSMGLHYDISSDKAISYEELCKLCMNIARTKLVESNVERDPMVEQLEKDKRKKLTYEIKRYKSNKMIDALVDEDISSMSLEQLENTLEQCVRYHENFKVLEISKLGLRAGGMIYDAAFPEGVPIGKNKRLVLKGVGKEVVNTLFNGSTTTGIAFQNILKKNNIHISDELLALVAFGEICLSKVEIKTIEPEDNKDGDKDKITMDNLNKISNEKNYSSEKLQSIDSDDEYSYSSDESEDEK